MRLLPLGDTAWTVEFGDRVDPALHGRVLGLLDALEKAKADEEFVGVVDLVPTFRSLTVCYDPSACDGARLGETLRNLAEKAGAARREGRHWHIPVCFDDDLAPDLADLAQAKGLTREAVIDLLTRTTFQVYMIGFMPGFPYMGGLPAELEMPRLSTPRQAVPARSLAVAGAMCAIYPWESPGGWRLLGRTPVPLFSAQNEASPSLLASGDEVRWRAIARSEFTELEAAAARGGLSRDSLLVKG
ncbi:5-oxoprolinase subunit PxpB [Xanthobacteraceae bacterium Astr-EGSB]|uniref:5-oxoprolinase subunit PxpB n=1 Tax=Astrobacterium formosum TaxID=3069710 RepID=UPI0027B32E9E|nr:5-oxoprolinase subunit PxpB [Xanthobacteraceae bacterium Astr-EGSB]